MDNAKKNISWDEYFSNNTEVDFVTLDSSNGHRYTHAKRFHVHACDKDDRHIHFNIFKRKDLLKYMTEPIRFEKELREISRHLYNISPQYKRTINYFANMSTMSYIIKPFKFDEEKYKKDNGKSFKSGYKKACDFLEILNLKHEMVKAKIIAWREDVFYGYIYKTKDSVYIRALNPDYCFISGVCDGCYKYAFDFQYFDQFKGNDKLFRSELNSYGSEFIEKYQIYKENPQKRWQELEHNNEFCLKISEDVDYPIIPLLASLPALYDIEDYKDIKLSASEIQNYKCLVLKVPISDEGQPLIPNSIINQYYDQINNVLPENVGLVMSPVQLQDINFEKDNSNCDEVKNAVNNYWDDVGISSLLFGGDNQSSTSLKISLIADETLVYSLNRQIERNVNRLLKSLSGSTKFQINILDISYYHQKDMHDLYIKDAQYGIPCKTSIMASLGFDQPFIDGMSFIENDYLNLVDKFVPLQSSYTTSANTSENNGRPSNDESNEDLTDSGEETIERDLNDV